jgi:hypothetical protein
MINVLPIVTQEIEGAISALYTRYACADSGLIDQFAEFRGGWNPSRAKSNRRIPLQCGSVDLLRDSSLTIIDDVVIPLYCANASDSTPAVRFE